MRNTQGRIICDKFAYVWIDRSCETFATFGHWDFNKSFHFLLFFSFFLWAFSPPRGSERRKRKARTQSEVSKYISKVPRVLYFCVTTEHALLEILNAFSLTLYMFLHIKLNDHNFSNERTLPVALSRAQNFLHIVKQYFDEPFSIRHYLYSGGLFRYLLGTNFRLKLLNRSPFRFNYRTKLNFILAAYRYYRVIADEFVREFLFS